MCVISIALELYQNLLFAKHLKAVLSYWVLRDNR
jgi:hypothetical protein